MNAVPLALIAAWGSLLDFPDMYEPELDAASMHEYLLGNAQYYPLLRRLGVDWREMNDLASLFAGGPIAGKVAGNVRSLVNA